jgi:protein-tyrosine kinase
MTDKEKGALRPEELTVLEQFDRNTGNILKYDQQTGQLDQDSRKLIRETDILKRLIETGMVLPGGWLTPKGLTECEARWSLPDQGDNSKKELSESNNDVQISNNLLSPQAEKFLKTLWNKEEKKPIDLTERMVVENYDENVLDKNLVSYLNPRSFEAEQFKILRTHIFFPLSGKIPRVIAVTSAVPGEGKSFIAANFAISIARELDRSVLLIDGDLRKPTIHKMFGFKDDLPGLSNYLTEKVKLSSLLVQTKVEKLKILAAGSPVDNCSELLSSEQMASMLSEIIQKNDDCFVILDTAPVLMTAEGMAITRCADGVLLVARTGYTSKAHFNELIKVIEPEKIVGTVLNYVDMRSLTQYEYKKYSKKYYGDHNSKA